MNCPDCNYVMSDLDKECPRCLAMAEKARESSENLQATSTHQQQQYSPQQQCVPPVSMARAKGTWYQVSGSCPYCQHQGGMYEMVKSGEIMPLWVIILLTVFFILPIILLAFNKPDEVHRHCSACGQIWRAI